MLIHKTLLKHYKNEKFIKIDNLGEMPKISDVTGSNLCRIEFYNIIKKIMLLLLQ